MKGARIALLAVLLTGLWGGRISATQIIASGGGETLISGGAPSGGPGSAPVPLKGSFTFSIHRNDKDGSASGTFECLAIAPEAVTGPGSATFNRNIMYVTGTINRINWISDEAISFSGVAIVTGVGAGKDVPFDCELGSTVRSGETAATAGGPGATMTLVVSGLTFSEVLQTGGIKINPKA